MKEELLCYIWENQYFDKRNLTTCQGQPIQVLYPGERNTNSGPDYSNARLKIEQTVWIGAVELHIKSSDWRFHGHHHDKAYDQVILHVVWINNYQVRSTTGSSIPSLQLNKRADRNLLQAYSIFSMNAFSVPCARHLPKVPQHVLEAMLEIAYMSRIQRKIRQVAVLFDSYAQDWEQVAYLILGKSFGFKTNADAFQSLVSIVPLSMVRKLRYNLFQLEALYFGQSGFLDSIKDDYYFRRLQHEFQYLRRKFQIAPTYLKPATWKFHRMRPGNFPVLRIAQFASLMQGQCFTFSDLRESSSVADFSTIKVLPSKYWRDHYDFGKYTAKLSEGKLGISSIESLVINAVIPLLAAYAHHTDQRAYMDRAISMAKQLKSEKNHIVTRWKDWGFEVSSAYGSQALIELNNPYCKARKCLSCKVGGWILSQSNQ